MKDLNGQWLLLIWILFGSLIAAVGWEIYSIYIDNARSEFTDVEAPLSSNTLLTQEVIEHLQTTN